MDGRKLTFTPDDLEDMYLDHGEEGMVYYFEDYALKIYHEKCGKVRLDEKTCLKMIPIKTYSILLPRGVIRDLRQKFIGYYTDYIPAHHGMKDILSLRMGDFTEKVNDVYTDLDTLAKNSISVYDFHPKNFVYDTDFFFLDPGSYQTETLLTYPQILKENQEVLSEFITDEMFAKQVFGNSKKKLRIIRDHFSPTFYLPEMFEAEASKDETVKQYVKRIAA